VTFYISALEILLLTYLQEGDRAAGKWRHIRSVLPASRDLYIRWRHTADTISADW